jgi:RNA polymerase sigma-70 factor (ECF subfamily)
LADQHRPGEVDRPRDPAQLYADEFGRVLATLVRRVGEFALAEDAVQEAFEIALARWSEVGEPRNPRAWLVATAHHKAIDRMRRDVRLREIAVRLAGEAALERCASPDVGDEDDASIPDERLRLIFTCCHPALAREAQVALALRSLCGLQVEQIARAFLCTPATIAQRLVRAKRKIRDAGIAYAVPVAEQLAARLESVMATLYLVFNDGHSARVGDDPIRGELCVEAIRLARLLATRLPDEPEPAGLLALMLLHDARRHARLDASGDLVTLDRQDRRAWDHAQIAEGLVHCQYANAVAKPGPYALQAAIAAEHAIAKCADDTRWDRIVDRFDALLDLAPSPVVALNRAVAIAMARGAEFGLPEVEALERSGELDDFHLLWSTRAELLRRLGRPAEAEAAYRQALDLAPTEVDRRFLTQQLQGL